MQVSSQKSSVSVHRREVIDLNSPDQQPQEQQQLSPTPSTSSAIMDESGGGGVATSSSFSSVSVVSSSVSTSLTAPRVAPAAPPSPKSSAPPPSYASPSPAPAPSTFSSASNIDRSASVSPAQRDARMMDGSPPPSHGASAPMQSSSLPPFPIPPMQELPLIKIGQSSSERAYYEQLSDLFSIIVTTEHIEKAYVRDAISEQDYTECCRKLIAQFKTLRNALDESAGNAHGNNDGGGGGDSNSSASSSSDHDLQRFCSEYGLDGCKAAIRRLTVGIPATLMHGKSGSGGGGGAGLHGSASMDSAAGSSGGGSGSSFSGVGSSAMQVAVFHSVQHFITMMDSLKLELRAVDELHPTLSELVDCLIQVPGLPSDHESLERTRSWLTQLYQMKAYDKLSEEQARQMSFDLDRAYNAFHQFVKNGK